MCDESSWATTDQTFECTGCFDSGYDLSIGQTSGHLYGVRFSNLKSRSSHKMTAAKFIGRCIGDIGLAAVYKFLIGDNPIEHDLARRLCIVNDRLEYSGKVTLVRQLLADGIKKKDVICRIVSCCDMSVTMVNYLLSRVKNYIWLPDVERYHADLILKRVLCDRRLFVGELSDEHRELFTILYRRAQCHLTDYLERAPWSSVEIIRLYPRLCDVPARYANVYVSQPPLHWFRHFERFEAIRFCTMYGVEYTVVCYGLARCNVTCDSGRLRQNLCKIVGLFSVCNMNTVVQLYALMYKGYNGYYGHICHVDFLSGFTGFKPRVLRKLWMRYNGDTRLSMRISASYNFSVYSVWCEWIIKNNNMDAANYFINMCRALKRSKYNEIKAHATELYSAIVPLPYLVKLL